jgi:hypothetical protein
MDIVTRSDPSVHHVDLPVSVGGAKVSVVPGSFKIEGTDFQLTETEEYALTTRTEDVGVTGYLVQDLVANEVRLVVTEAVAGLPPTSIDRAKYRLLALLFKVQIPANATSLDPALLNRWVILPMEEVS